MDHKKNVYWKHLNNPSYVEKWCERVCAIPDFTIESIVDSVPASALSRPDERARLVKFLVNRKTYLLDHIKAAGVARFPDLKWEH